MKAAFFDFTGTLLEERSIALYLHFLAENGFLSQTALKRLHSIHDRHKTHALSDFQTSQAIIHTVAKGLKGVLVLEFSAAHRRFLKTPLPAYAYTAALLAALKKNGFQTVVVSGAFAQAVVPAAKQLGIRHAFGSVLETANGRFTGKLKTDLTVPENKSETVRRFARRHNIRLSESLAFGDTELDAAMLAAVGHPFALNASPGLTRICRQNGWKNLTHQQALKMANCIK
ncbi:MAG: HAD family phosphatase [Candidatus Micrarchaeota archaeon]|nr:HAD family phosphatase [Candidatus Micrarchaeota archaeon]